MNTQAKITSKGQITVPLSIRKELGVEPGDSIEFKKEGGKVTVTPVKKENPFAKYRGIERVGRGADLREIVTEIRDMRDGVEG
jgi:AbrB family looped-hinge helix DNA binding protein